MIKLCNTILYIIVKMFVKYKTFLLHLYYTAFIKYDFMPYFLSVFSIIFNVQYQNLKQ